MHELILRQATSEQMRSFLNKFLKELDSSDRCIYEKAEIDLYKAVVGEHFNEELLELALYEMRNEDGTIGKHWSVEQTESAGKSMDIKFDKFNRYDWCYAMNLMRSDFYGSVPDETSTYAKMAKKFLCDKDAKDNKAFIYYVSVAS